MEIASGQQLGHYTIVEQWGAGAMGIVWRAVDELLGGEVAIKVLPPELARDREAMDRLREEARILLGLTHEGIVRLHTFEKVDGIAFLVMEFIKGPTLNRILLDRRSEGRVGFSGDEAIWTLASVCAPLEYAHSRGVLHRDLKPANLMLTDTPRSELHGAGVELKLTDFGLAFIAASTMTQITGHKPSGTLPFMAPEVLLGRLPTVAADVYSLGATLYTLVSGDRPFTHGDISIQVLRVDPPPLDSGHRGLDLAVARAMSKDPDERPQSVQELLSMAQSTAKTRPTTLWAVDRPRSGAGALSEDAPAARQSNRLLPAIALVSLGILASAVILLLNPRPLFLFLLGVAELVAGSGLMAEHGHVKLGFRLSLVLIVIGLVQVVVAGVLLIA